jgi:SET domain-containing protein
MGAKTIGGVSLVAIGYALGLKIKELNDFEKPLNTEVVKAKKIIKNPETKKQVEEFTLSEVDKIIKDAQTPEAQKMIAKEDSIASSYWESSLEQMGLQDEI